MGWKHAAEDYRFLSWLDGGVVAKNAGGNLRVGFVEFRCEAGWDMSHFAEVRLRELKVVGVHKGGLNEGTGLASTLAPIFWIDEAAVVLKILVDVVPRVREDLAEVGGG